MGGEDRTLLFAATGLRVGAERKLMAAWRDKGEDEGRGGRIEAEKVEQREREGERNERGRERGGLPACLSFGFHKSLNKCICIRSSVSSFFPIRIIERILAYRIKKLKFM